jgi:sterol desaturase/sphingolipid hydroxylase (fatty acid hydroxylase superfamily)/uncharacterized membrane protein YhhN
MSPSQVIVLATPVFLLLIALEYAWGRLRRRNTYQLNDAITSIGLGMLSQISAIFTRLLRVGIYTVVYAEVALWRNNEFWTAWYGWLLALVFYDFCYYWLHRAGHEVGVFWAAHVVHHHSQSFNLSTALRQPSTGALLGWIFYLPMAVAGVPPLVFGIVSLIDLLYQFWVHTEHVGKLGWFDRWFCSPSNHRVHHAVNQRYLDRNYGGILIIWDRLFGTFQEEDSPCIYGTRSALDSWDPLWANVEVYAGLLHDSWHARRWRDKLLVWLKPPGWRPADVAARFPKPPFEMAKVRRYDPPMTRTIRFYSALHFLALLGGVSLLLWHGESLPLADAAIWVGTLTAALWLGGAVMQDRVTVGEALLIEAALLSTASAATGLLDLHHVFKPLALTVAMLWAIHRHGARRPTPAFALLLLALAFSLAGDVFLMLSGYFIPGLLAFLCAHLAYIALFRQGQAWFPRRGALALTLAFGTGMYVVLWQGGLPPGLRLPVAAYVLVITLMAAQAIGRAQVLRGSAAWQAALGAGCFMLSDTLLALNKFVTPLPLSALWVLASYYVAQLLIVRGTLAEMALSRR